MAKRLGYRFDAQALAEQVRAKRHGEGLSLRAVAAKLDMAPATLSRIENAKYPPDPDNMGVICYWLGVNPGTFWLIDDPTNDDPITVQLRAAKNMSAETASAFMDLFRAAYAEILEQANEDEKA